MSNVIEYDVDEVRVIELSHNNKHNPFDESLEMAIKNALTKANKDNEVQAIVVTGGNERSFSVGGDFSEVKNLSGGDDVDRWIDRVIALYSTVLFVEKPTVAAIEGFAIGMGLQFSMMFDWRVMSETAQLRMPELKHGIGCSLGAEILHQTIGYNRMQQIVYGCDDINPDDAIKYSLVNEIVAPNLLLERSIEIAKKMANFPSVSFKNTKRGITKFLLDRLNIVAEESKKVHRACFTSKTPQAHFKSILKEKYV